MLLIKICVCLCLLTLVEIKTLNKIVVVNLRQVTLQLINSRFFFINILFSKVKKHGPIMPPLDEQLSESSEVNKLKTVNSKQ